MTETEKILKNQKTINENLVLMTENQTKIMTNQQMIVKWQSGTNHWIWLAIAVNIALNYYLWL